MKHVRFALALSTAILAAAAMPALAEERNPLANAQAHVNDLPVDVSIDIIHDAGDVSGSIDVNVHSEGADRTTHVDLPPLGGGDHAGTPNEHASDRAFEAVGGPDGPDSHANANAFDHGAGAPDGDHPGFDVPVGAPEDVSGDHPGFDVPVGAPEDLPTDQPGFDVPVGAPEDLPTDQPGFDVPVGAPADLPADVPTDLPADLPSDLPDQVPTDLPAGGPLGH
jgi:hypothetical protein